MAQRGLTVAKATPEDIDCTNNFLSALDNLFDNRFFNGGEDHWDEWDDEDTDKIMLLKIRKDLSIELSCDEDEVDNRIVLFEFIKDRFKDCEYSWRRVLFNTQVLIDSCTDPFSDVLEHDAFTYRAINNSMLGE